MVHAFLMMIKILSGIMYPLNSKVVFNKKILLNFYELYNAHDSIFF